MRRSSSLLLLLSLVLGLVAAAPAAAADTSPPWLSIGASWRHAVQDLYVSAYPDDRNRGGSAIASVTVTVDGVTHALPAADGAYDEPFEVVETLLGGVPAHGDIIEICGWATDAAGNSSTRTCWSVDTTDRLPPHVISKPYTTPKLPHVTDSVRVTARLEDAELRSIIALAELTVDGGPPLAMFPSDGAYDEVTEYVSLDLGVVDPGTHRLCVYGTDAEGNRGEVVTGIAIGGGSPFQCVDVTVADRVGPVVTSLAATPASPAFDEEFVLRVVASDAGTGGSKIVGARLTVDGVKGCCYGWITSTDGADAVLDIYVSGFAEVGAHELCVDVKDAAGQLSDVACVAIEVAARSARGDVTLRPLVRPEGRIGPAATFTIDVEQWRDEPALGGFSYSEPGIAFEATQFSTAAFEHLDLQRTFRATGVGLLHGTVLCDFEVRVTDSVTWAYPTGTALVALTVSCNGVIVVDGIEWPESGSLDVRA